MPTPMPLNRSWVMNRAWDYIRQWGGKPDTFHRRRAMQFAWDDMKVKMRGGLLPDELTPQQRELISLQNKSHLSAEDYKRITVLSKAIAHEQAEEEYKAKRDLIKAGPCEVTFTKADGAERVIRIEHGKLVAKGATKSGERATKTRKARHPNLLPVWDADKGAPRSVNLSTISRIVTASQTHVFKA